VIFEVLSAVAAKNTIARDEKPCSIVEVDLRDITKFLLDYSLVLLHGRGISYDIEHYWTARGT
jgi:hypothetical protein